MGTGASASAATQEGGAGVAAGTDDEGACTTLGDDDHSGRNSASLGNFAAGEDFYDDFDRDEVETHLAGFVAMGAQAFGMGEGDSDDHSGRSSASLGSYDDFDKDEVDTHFAESVAMGAQAFWIGEGDSDCDSSESEEGQVEAEESKEVAATTAAAAGQAAEAAAKAPCEELRGRAEGSQRHRAVGSDRAEGSMREPIDIDEVEEQEHEAEECTSAETRATRGHDLVVPTHGQGARLHWPTRRGRQQQEVLRPTSSRDAIAGQGEELQQMHTTGVNSAAEPRPVMTTSGEKLTDDEADNMAVLIAEAESHAHEDAANEVAQRLRQLLLITKAMMTWKLLKRLDLLAPKIETRQAQLEQHKQVKARWADLHSDEDEVADNQGEKLAEEQVHETTPTAEAHESPQAGNKKKKRPKPKGQRPQLRW